MYERIEIDADFTIDEYGESAELFRITQVHSIWNCIETCFVGGIFDKIFESCAAQLIF